jgi:Zn-dependent M16 (insulinase) family peptidase
VARHFRSSKWLEANNRNTNMKNAIEWFKEKGFDANWNGKIKLKDIIALQNDAAKSALMTAQMVASEVIQKEATKYAVIGDPIPGPPAEMSLSGLQYKVTSAIVAMADKLEYIPEASNVELSDRRENNQR